MSNPSTIFLLLLLLLVTILFTASYVASEDNPTPQDFLDPHNSARTEVGVGPLVWNDDVANYAMQYAQKRAGDCQMQHSGGPYGENLAAGVPLSAADAVGLWVGEKSNYDHGSNSCVGGECLHYTQVVWKDSVRLGCARVQCSNGGWFVICSYDPPGNYQGQRPY